MATFRFYVTFDTGVVQMYDFPGDQPVGMFIKSVKKEFELDIPLSKIKLFTHDGEKPKIDVLMSTLQNTSETPHLFASYDSRPVKKIKTTHHSKERIERWEKINDILHAAELVRVNESRGKKHAIKSLAFSSMTMILLNSVYYAITEPYIQASKDVPFDILTTLREYLALLAGHLGEAPDSNDAKLHYQIAPILVYVTHLFKNEKEPAKVIIGKSFDGVAVNAHGQFEFMIVRGNKRVCVVQAKKDDMKQGVVQNLVGMEVVSELGELDVVYGIVTNYTQWIFLKSRNDGIEQDDTTLECEHNIPTMASLRKIAGKIYAMLSDE